MLKIDKCIICFNKNLNNEHIFPKFLGGRLKLPILCKRCNNRFGSELISKIKFLEGILYCVDFLNKNKNLPENLSQEILNRQEGITLTPTGSKVKTFYSKEKKACILREGKLEDGSLILDEKKAKNFFSKKFKDKKLDEIFKIKNKIIPLGVASNFSDRIFRIFRILNFSPIKFFLKSKYKLDNFFIKKAFILISFEWLVLFINNFIFEPYFDGLRHFLINEKEVDTPEKIEYSAFYLNTKPQPYHLIYPEFLSDKTLINIRIFEYINIQIIFKNLVINTNSIPYLIGLNEKIDYIAKNIEEGKKNIWYEFL